jgi:type I restriction enzyme S subunit
LAEVERRSVGVSYPAINASDLASIPVHVHLLPRQRAIADYLDRETARIDALIAAKERVLGLLAEKRRALITRAVTRGLDHNAPLRDSGIPWLGEIPAHWELKRGKWLFRERDERSEEGEETLLSLRMARGLVRHNDVSEKQTRPEELVGYKKTSHGELVVNRMRAAIGLIAIAPQEGLVSPDYAVFVPAPSTYVDYYGYLFTTKLLGSVFRCASSGMGTGTQGFLRLYSESFLALWFPSPPEAEQRLIVSYIGKEGAKLASLRAAAERSITLLRERRSALIAAAVTGRLDVGGAA